MKNNIQDKLNDLSETDIYSMMLFALYKLKDIPEYSVLSELVYLTDKKSLFNLLEYFGGMTIRIPSVEELKLMLNVLLLYQLVHFEDKDFNEALKELDMKDSKLSDVKDAYLKVSEVLDKYEFKR